MHSNEVGTEISANGSTQSREAAKSDEKLSKNRK